MGNSEDPDNWLRLDVVENMWKTFKRTRDPALDRLGGLLLL